MKQKPILFKAYLQWNLVENTDDNTICSICGCNTNGSYHQSKLVPLFGGKLSTKGIHPRQYKVCVPCEKLPSVREYMDELAKMKVYYLNKHSS